MEKRRGKPYQELHLNPKPAAAWSHASQRGVPRPAGCPTPGSASPRLPFFREVFFCCCFFLFFFFSLVLSVLFSIFLSFFFSAPSPALPPAQSRPSPGPHTGPRPAAPPAPSPAAAKRTPKMAEGAPPGSAAASHRRRGRGNPPPAARPYCEAGQRRGYGRPETGSAGGPPPSARLGRRGPPRAEKWYAPPGAARLSTAPASLPASPPRRRPFLPGMRSGLGSSTRPAGDGHGK